MSPNTRLARSAFLGAALAIGSAVLTEPLHAQWVRVHEQFYLPASHNWVFRDNYAAADRLFNAFDYGHAILYEELYRRPQGPVERLEVDEYEFLTEGLLRRPPRVPLEEGAIEVAYAKLAPEAKNMFHWAHILHRQLYDILADERLTMAQKDDAIAEVLAYYKSRPDVAFSSVPKSMEIMDGQYYSLAFRERYPKFNGLIWAYHWLQVGLYEPLLVNQDVASRTAGVNATVGRFWQMLEDAPRTMPYLMPMTAGVAPTFAERYPEASIIFDNLHMMHDVISDILASPDVPRQRKREEILRAVELFRDDTSYAISVDEWRMMGDMMGVHNMGGVAAGFLPELPTPTVARGMSMAGMDHSAMEHGRTPGMEHDQHAAPPAADSAQPQRHEEHEPPGEMTPHGMMDGEHMRLMHDFHLRVMADSVIRQRIMSDTTLHRMMMEMMEHMPADAREEMMHRMHGPGADAGSASGAVMSPPAMDLLLRLLSDEDIEARVRQDPQLRSLLEDEAVVACLARLRELQAEGRPLPSACPRPTASPAHRH